MLDVPAFAEEQIMDFLERNLGGPTNRLFGARSVDFYKKYFPDYAAEVEGRLREAEELGLAELLEQPMKWKELTLPSGTKARMQYGGRHHFAVVREGKLEDESGRYSPSEWARNVAAGTSRNAWRDIEVKEPGSTIWLPAQFLRDKERAKSGGHNAQD
jgi:hypothetical protein